jgi:hypothetical protein
MFRACKSIFRSIGNIYAGFDCSNLVVLVCPKDKWVLGGVCRLIICLEWVTRSRSLGWISILQNVVCVTVGVRIEGAMVQVCLIVGGVLWGGGGGRLL